MKLYAISDIHLRHDANREMLRRMGDYPDDWLIVAGDVGHTEEDLRFALTELDRRFDRLIWVPGNHDLWSIGDQLVGEAKYRQWVSICREHGVLTPEDPYPTWPGPPRPHKIAPLFLLYDYTFRPDHVPVEQAVEWAAESKVICADEHHLRPDPYPSRPAWCAARCSYSGERLAQERQGLPTVLINHWPLRQDLAILPRIPRFSVWCGTRTSEHWHLRYEATAVVFGHLHIRGTRVRDGVRFEEVSLGYPRQYRAEQGPDSYLREILPGPKPPGSAGEG